MLRIACVPLFGIYSLERETRSPLPHKAYARLTEQAEDTALKFYRSRSGFECR